MKGALEKGANPARHTRVPGGGRPRQGQERRHDGSSSRSRSTTSISTSRRRATRPWAMDSSTRRSRAGAATSRTAFESSRRCRRSVTEDHEVPDSLQGRRRQGLHARRIQGHRREDFLSAWPETTTLYATLLPGHVAEGAQAHADRGRRDNIRPETFFSADVLVHVQGPTLAARTEALARFGLAFFGKLWDVYGRQVGPT